MKSIALLSFVFGVCMTALTYADNPFLEEWTTPFGVPPFEAIQLEHYQEAFEAGMKQQQQEIRAIYMRRSTPTFENTIAELDRSGTLLDRVNNVFNAMESSMTNEGIQALSKEIAPRLSQHRDEILLNELLFQRVKAVHAAKDTFDLTAEQKKLLEETYKDFVRGGANLPPAEKQLLKDINSQLSVLAVRFGENILKENNRFELVIEDQGDLAGLPDTVIAAAAETGTERGHDGKWVFTLQKPSLIPFLQYSQKRELREKIYLGYINRGNHDDELDTKKILAEMAALRVQRQVAGISRARALRAGREYGQGTRQRLQAAQRCVATGSQTSPGRSCRHAADDRRRKRRL